MMFKLLIILFSLFIYLLFLYYKRLNKIKEAKNIIKNFKNKILENKYFNEIPKYYINLDRSLDRRKNIEKLIKKYNIENIERVRAFDGKKINNLREGEIDGYNYRNLKGTPNCKKSELAITMSHILAIKKAYENNYENIIIMEDDIDFFLMPYWDINFKNLINDIPRDCDILLLAHCGSKKEIKIVSFEEKDVRVSGVCYLMTRKGMKKFSKILNNKEFLFNQKKILWDDDFLRKLKIYHTNKSLFLLYNFNFLSEREKESHLFFDESSYKILKSYNKNVSL